MWGPQQDTSLSSFWAPNFCSKWLKQLVYLKGAQLMKKPAGNSQHWECSAAGTDTVE